MPFDPAGNASLPPSTWATAGQTIRVEQHNPAFRDVEQMLSGVLKRDGRDGMVGPLNMGGFPIRGLQDGISPSDGATVGQIGDTFGTLVNSASEKPAPVDADFLPIYDSAASNVLRKLTWANLKAALKTYFDTVYPSISAALLRAGGTMTGKLTLDGNPSNALHAAPKQYVDAQALAVSIGTKFTNVAASRSRNTVYQNTTGRWLAAYIGSINNGNSVEISPNGSTWFEVIRGGSTYSSLVLIPPGWRYRANPSGGTLTWLETID